ncbi:MAG: hypothetical protein SFT94_04995 [Pseudanabaenaceae cyanobacterium bins.68]|nr:hypothetical protein [Pseudanabaenaceae cyanobacterium bins.68]
MTANLGAGANITEDSGEGVVLFGLTLNSRTIGIILAVAGVGLAIYGTTQYTMPNFELIEKNETAIKTKRESIDSKSRQITAKGDVVAKVEIARRKNQAVLELLPTRESINTLLIDLNAQIPQLVAIPNQFGLVVEARSGLKGYKPAPGTENEQFTPNNLKVEFGGTYEDILEVTRKIERIKPLLQMKNLRVKPAVVAPSAENKRYTPEQQTQILQVLPPVLDISFDLIANTPKPPSELPSGEAPANPPPAN